MVSSHISYGCIAQRVGGSSIHIGIQAPYLWLTLVLSVIFGAPIELKLVDFSVEFCP